MTDPHDTKSLFAEWCSRRGSEDPEPFESFLARHPSHADALRRMFDGWQVVLEQVERAAQRQGSFADALRDRFGSAANPEISLDGDETKVFGLPRPTDERTSLYQDLKARGPTSSRYRLDGEVAHGGMGAILRVYDKDLRRTLAMKVMLEEKQGRLSRFLEEAQVTGQLDHPGIVPVHELGIDARGKVFFTMKLVKGKDLREVFDMVKLGVDGWNVTRALAVLQRVCEAMAFAHEKNVIHRDLKPGNVMVGRHGEVYVMDWGLARVLGTNDTKDVRVAPESQSVVNTERRESVVRPGRDIDTPDSPLFTMDGDAIGTPSYMPLEQAEGNLELIGPQSDVYAVGAMLYHLLSGHAPYADSRHGAAGRSILTRVIAGPPEPIRSKATTASAELIAICEKAMARNPTDRYATMAELGDDLRAYLERRVVKAHKTGVIAETKMWVARNRGLAAAIALVFVALAAFAWQQRIAAANARSVLQLADVKELRDLQTRGRELLDDHGAVYRTHRGHYTVVAALAAWIKDAESIAKRLPTHEATLSSIEARGRRRSGSDGFEFDSREDAWWHSAVSELVSGFRSLYVDDPNTTSIRAMRERVATFETVFAHSVGDHRAEWDACIESIADPTQCPQYGGLTIEPQVGLRPIGRDPRTGMWEFWFVDVTGVKPERDADGRLVLTDDFGLVFVLLPGGTFRMGAQRDDPNGVNYDPMALEDESPVHPVSLAPFFLSKYEMTEHQWILGTRDDAWPYGRKNSRLPVKSVSWEEATTALRRLQLELPTEARWEYACRAGTSTPWSTGAEKSSLHGSANLGDADLADGMDDAVAVGSLLPNPFGLHDMHGNRWEWCLDGYDGARDYGNPLDPLTGEHLGIRPRYRALRGGLYSYEAARTRCSYRYGTDAGFRYDGIGLRPSRSVMRD